MINYIFFNIIMKIKLATLLILLSISLINATQD
jgi:hypothetical protein